MAIFLIAGHVALGHKVGHRDEHISVLYCGFQRGNIKSMIGLRISLIKIHQNQHKISHSTSVTSTSSSSLVEKGLNTE